ncbi:MAG: hypothetical protein VKP62_05970 [Candidatus Sericytochromatia bacterium]|nr:hypothetical protein [Candidatus Sericytochromatia bacterium]
MLHSLPPLRPTLLLAIAGLSLVACRPWLANVQSGGLPKLQFRDVDAFVRTEWVGQPATMADVEAFATSVRGFRTPGLYARDIPGVNNSVCHVYAYADPVMVVGTAGTLEFPEAAMTSEPASTGGTSAGSVRMTRQPMFFLREMRVKWQLEGVDSPAEQVVDVQAGMRTNPHALPRIPITHAAAAIIKLKASEPGTFGLRGTITVDLSAKDLDPLVPAAQAELTVSRKVPVLFVTGMNIEAEARAGTSPVPGPGTVTGGGILPPLSPLTPASGVPSPPGSAGPTASPAATPVATPSASPVP